MKAQSSPWLKKVGDLVNRKPGFVIVFYTLIYFALTLQTAALKPLWYDELFTRVIATRSSFSEVLRALQQGWDPQPPLYYLLVRVGHAVSDSELGLRLPSVAGLWLGSLCLFFHLRGLITPVFAASALFLPWATMVAPFAAEARPYALLFCFASAGILFWGESLGRSSRWPLAGLFLSLIAVSTVHYYGFLAFGAFVAGETVHAVTQRRVRWIVWVLMALAFVPAALHWPLARESMVLSSEGAWNAPHLSTLTQVYLSTKASVMMGLLALVLTAMLCLPGRKAPAIPAEIMAAWVVTILAPVIGLATAFAISGLIAERYVLFWHAGAISALLYCAARMSRQDARAGALLLGLTASLFVGKEARAVRYASSERRQLNQALAEAGGLLATPRFQTMPLVVTDVFMAFQLRHYAPRSTRERIVYVTDGDLQPKGSPHYSIDHILHTIYLRGFPLPVRDAAEYYNGAGPFLLAYAELWGGAALIRIHERGCAVAPEGVWNGQTLYLVQRCN